MYTQCKLEKENTYQVCYIPNKYAKIGKIVKIKLKDGWDDGWKVTSVGGEIDSPTNIKRAIKNHRKNTGDSMKKEKKRNETN